MSLVAGKAQPQSKLLIFGVPILVLWLGLLLRAPRVAPILFAISVAAMSAKVTTLCVVCGEGTGIPFYASIVALVLGSIALTITQIAANPIGMHCARSLALVLAIGQLALLLTYPTSSCNACIVAWLAIGPLAISYSWANDIAAKWSGTAMRVLMVALAIATFFALTNLSGSRGNGTSLKSDSPRKHFSSFVGSNATTGPLKLIEDDQHSAKLICLSRNTCVPCQEAKTYFSALPNFHIHFVEVLPRGSMQRVDSSQFVPSPDISIQTPTFLVVGSDGIIYSQTSGWSNEADWKKAITQTLTDSLQIAEIGK